MKSTALILLLTVAGTVSYSQGDLAQTMLPELQWNKGNVVLTDGTQMSGMLKYNERVGLLTYEDGSGDNRTLTARTISTFEYFDEKVKRRRVFYSIEYGDPERQGNKRPFLFELLKEFDDYALLSRYDPMDVRQVVAPVSFNAMPATSSPRTIIDLAETVYILTPEGDMHPIFRLSEFIADGGVFDSEKKKRRTIDKLLTPYFNEEGYQKMMDYVDAKELDIWEKEDFINALTFYKETVQKINTESAALNR